MKFSRFHCGFPDPSTVRRSGKSGAPSNATSYSYIRHFIIVKIKIGNGASKIGTTVLSIIVLTLVENDR